MTKERERERKREREEKKKREKGGREVDRERSGRKIEGSEMMERTADLDDVRDNEVRWVMEGERKEREGRRERREGMKEGGREGRRRM